MKTTLTLLTLLCLATGAQAAEAPTAKPPADAALLRDQQELQRQKAELAKHTHDRAVRLNNANRVGGAKSQGQIKKDQAAISQLEARIKAANQKATDTKADGAKQPVSKPVAPR